MEKGNVLVIGNSGVGKSTLINAILGKDAARAAWGVHGVTADLEVYTPENEAIPFNVVDSIGFEAGLFQRLNAVSAVQRWCAEGIKKENRERVISVIWFCVDGTRGRLFQEDIKAMLDAVKTWKSVPIITVITKSYSEPDRASNIAMVKNAFESVKGASDRMMDIIPVVAQTYNLNETAYVEPCGISELIEATNVLLPEGIQAAKDDVAAFVLNRKRLHAQSVVTAATAAAAVVGAVPIPFSDAALLMPTETAEVYAIARIYGIQKDADGKQFLQRIIEAGTVSVAAKTFISALKAIPGLHIATSVLNAVTAGGIAAAIGEGCIVIFEQIYLGKKNVHDIEWVKMILESKMAGSVVEKIQPVLDRLGENAGKAEILKAVREIAESLFNRKNKSDPS